MYLKTEKFHTCYRLKELETNEELTDVIEIHFIEIPKLPEESDEKDILMAWTEFLRDPESEKVRSLEMSIEEIREAERKGEKNKAVEIAKNLLDVLDDEIISLKTELNIEKIKQLREED